MRKTKRNEPCPCGSGKKYKKCCGRNSNTNTNIQSMNDTLYRIHQELISFATNNYHKELEKQLNMFESTSIKDDETKDVFQIGITPWIVATMPCLNNKDTIFDRFYRKIQAKISPLAKSILVKWPYTLPSVYEVVSIDSPKPNFLQVKELMTSETFDIPFDRANSNFTEGSLLVGMLIPFAQHDNFLFSMITLYDRDTSYYIELLKTYANKEGGMKAHYAYFLEEALQGGMTDFTWNEPQHEEVATFFTKQMESKNMNNEVIANGISLWSNFCEKQNPTIQKIEPYAAALDYYIQKELLNEANVRQVQVAEQYNTSPSTLSRIYRNMMKVLKTE